MNEDEQIRENILARENAERVHNTLIANAKEEGFEQGIEQGTKQEKIEIAKNMLDMEINLDTILKSTGLTKDEIENLK